jgi:membrane protein DedA with SNARE-associated domain
MLVAAGMATAGPRDVVLLIATSVTGSLVGDHILYALGMRRGTRLLASTAGFPWDPCGAWRKP